jgi:hypothetical protein
MGNPQIPLDMRQDDRIAESQLPNVNSRFEINGRGIIVPHNLSEGRNYVELLSPPEEILWPDECALPV